MEPELSIADVLKMREQSEQLVEMLRSAAADLPAGAAREMTDDLLTTFTSAADDFFPAAEAMVHDLENLRASNPRTAEPASPDAQPDELGPRLREELLRRYPEAPPATPPKKKSYTEESIGKGVDDSLWTEMD